MIQKNVVPLHPQLRNNMLEVAMILGYGVMVTLQILVLSFLVRVRVSQLHLFFLKAKLGYGVMVTLQILVLSFLVRVRVSQLESIFHFERCFFRIFTFWGLGRTSLSTMFFKRKEGVSWNYDTPSYLISIKSFICSLHQ